MSSVVFLQLPQLSKLHETSSKGWRSCTYVTHRGFLTYEFGPLRWGPEQWILLWEGLWAPVTCKDQDVGSRAFGCALCPVGPQRSSQREAKCQKYNEELLQPTTGQVVRWHHLKEMEKWKVSSLHRPSMLFYTVVLISVSLKISTAFFFPSFFKFFIVLLPPGFR